MELRKEEIQLLREKGKAASQVTFDVDFNVPDAKPDIGRMIQNKGEVAVEEVRISDGRGFIKGSLNVDLLYVADQEGKIYSLSAKLPMEETMNLDGIVSGDKMCLKWEIEDLCVHMIHSRKLNIKAIVSFFAVVDEICGIRLPVEVKEEEISVMKKKIPLLSLGVHKKDTMRVKEEMSLASNKPNVAEILWSTVELRGLDFRPEEDSLSAKGELALFILYSSDDETNSLQWMEYTIPFSKKIECGGAREGMLPHIEAMLVDRTIEVKPDSDGEERVFFIDAVVELNMKLYEEEEKEVILDAYTPSKECVLRGKKEKLERLLVRNYAKCRVTDHVEVKETQGKVLQICHTQGKVRIDKTRLTENGILVDGILFIKVLYIIGNDDMPFYSMEAMIPFSHTLEAKGITAESEYCLTAELEQLSANMVDSNEIEIKAIVSMNALVVQKEEQFIIEKIEEEPLDMKKIRNMPGMVVYVTKEGDTLWEIAKKFYTTVEEICRLNELNEENVMAGQPLLLVKKVSS